MRWMKLEIFQVPRRRTPDRMVACDGWRGVIAGAGRSPLGESHDLSQPGDAGMQAAMEPAALVELASQAYRRRWCGRSRIRIPWLPHARTMKKNRRWCPRPARRKRTEGISSAGKPRPRISDGRSSVRGGLASTGFHDSAVAQSVGQFAVCGSGSRGDRPARISWVFMDTVTVFSSRSMM